MIDEGYTKFQCEWRHASAVPAAVISDLNEWRNHLYEAGLIGYCEEQGVGFGNISMRADGYEQFIISGTQSGNVRYTNEAHYSLVTEFDIDANRVVCKGPVQASSEALTHAALYEIDDEIQAVVHVHSSLLWKALLYKVPTTTESAQYGTAEMAHEFRRLYQVTDLSGIGIAAMAGHQAGLVTFGPDVEQAAQRILGLMPGC